MRRSAVTERADVVLPVAAVAEKSGSFLDWEGRVRRFEQALSPEVVQTHSGQVTDLRVLDRLADAMDVHLGLPDVDTARRELDELGVWDGPRALPPHSEILPLPAPGVGQAVLATWHQLLDDGRLQDGEKYLDAPALMVTIDWTEDPGTVSRSAPSPGRQCRVAGSRRWTFPRRTGSRHMLVIYPSADHQGNRGYPWFLPWSRGSRRPVPEAGGPVFDRSRCRAHGIGSAAFARPRVFPEPSTFQFVTLRNQFLHRLLLKWTVRISAAKRL